MTYTMDLLKAQKQDRFLRTFQGDTTERITAWEVEIATYERDSGKILDDEIKVGGESGHMSSKCPKKKVTTVQDAPGGAENTRCNTNKWQLCLMLGMFRRRAGTRDAVAQNVSGNVEEVFFACAGASHVMFSIVVARSSLWPGSTQQRAC